MAGFKTHIEFSSIGSGILATTLIGANLVSVPQAVALWGVGSLGGILPDIDSDNSSALSIIFNALSLVIVGLMLSRVAAHLSLVEIWASILICIAALNFIVRPIFEAYTVHRGIFHSFLCGVLFSMISMLVAYYVVGTTPFLAWLSACFTLFGFLLHLILDEIYSVDLMNVRVKRSFGTALKLFDYKNKVSSAMMLLCIVALAVFSPPFDQFNQKVFNVDVVTDLKQKLLPNWLLKETQPIAHDGGNISYTTER